MSFLSNVETKVIAAIGGGAGGAALSTFLLWLLGVTVWGQSASSDKAAAAVAAVPGPVEGLLAIVLAGFGAGVAGWLAPHTNRGDLTPTTSVSQPTITAPVVAPAQTAASDTTTVTPA